MNVRWDKKKEEFTYAWNMKPDFSIYDPVSQYPVIDELTFSTLLPFTEFS